MPLLLLCCPAGSDLGKLKRHPDLQRRYDLWTEQVKHQFGGGSTGAPSSCL